MNFSNFGIIQAVTDVCRIARYHRQSGIFPDNIYFAGFKGLKFGMLPVLLYNKYSIQNIFDKPS